MQFVMHYPLNKTLQIPLYHQFFIQLFRTFFFLLLLLFHQHYSSGCFFSSDICLKIRTHDHITNVPTKNNRQIKFTPREFKNTFLLSLALFNCCARLYLFRYRSIVAVECLCVCVCACFFLFAKISLFAIVPRLAYEIRFAIMMIVSALVSIAHNVSFIMNSL